MLRPFSLFLVVCLLPFHAPAQSDPTETIEVEGPMTPSRLNAVLGEIDPDVQTRPGAARLSLDDVPVTIIYDPFANRMRALVPIASAENMTDGQMLRLLQANFDTALDARYAVAEGRIWAVFIHPLAELNRQQLIAGVAQTVALAQSYGTTYSSSTMLFGRGDSAGRLEQLLEPDTDL